MVDDEAEVGRALDLARRGDIEGAAAALDRVLAGAPEAPLALLHRMNLARRLGDGAAADALRGRLARVARERRPEDLVPRAWQTESQLLLAAIYEAAGDAARAAAIAPRVAPLLRDRAESPETLGAVAAYLEARGDLEQSARLRRQAGLLMHPQPQGPRIQLPPQAAREIEREKRG